MDASTRNLSLAAIAAALLHVLLLVQAMSVREDRYFQEQPLTVSLFEERINRESEPEAKETEVSPEVVQPSPSPPQVDKLIIATKPDKEAAPRVVIQTSQKSTQFKNWLKSETDSFSSQNPDSIGVFDNTFAAPAPYKSPEELSVFSPNPTDVRNRGDFMTEDNGKRTCYVRTFDLLDISSSPEIVSKDCTPTKKFELKLNQPNNGWADR